MINREKLKRFVELFYQPTFKILPVNSVDGENFSIPETAFVSLGLTTSMQVLDRIAGIIDACDDYSAEVAELASTKRLGQFCNYVTSDLPGKYKAEETEGVMNHSEAVEELNSLKKFIVENEHSKDVREEVNRFSMLSDAINKLDSSEDPGWSGCSIQKLETGQYRIFHNYINYLREGDVEYRIGILVKPKN